MPPPVGELEAARLGDLDESRRAWLVRAAVSKTRQARWVELPEDLFEGLLERLPVREDRDPEARLFAGVTADRLRTALGRACRDAGVPRFTVHSLRHRRTRCSTAKASTGPRSALAWVSARGS